MKRLLLLSSLLLSVATGQTTRYVIATRSEQNRETDLVRILRESAVAPNLVFTSRQQLRRTDLNINFVSIEINDQDFERTSDALRADLNRGFIFTLEPNIAAANGISASDALMPDPAVPNLVLDALVPGGPVLEPVPSPLKGKVLVDIIGTGVDEDHPDLLGLNFAPALSVTFSSGGGVLPGNLDYHDHETRIAGCLAGNASGLLTRLGTRTEADFRSVLFYGSPNASSSAYLSDCLAAITSIIDSHRTRIEEQPYLKNHAAVACFSHTMEMPYTRVGVLDSLFEELWEFGIFTSLASGNNSIAAAATSPAGAGEWISYKNQSGNVVDTPLWPPTNSLIYTSYNLPLSSEVGFQNSLSGSTYHLKSGAHNCSNPPGLWINSNRNTMNPTDYGTSGLNAGVDLLAPGEFINFPSTTLATVSTAASLPDPVEIDGMPYFMTQGYRTGSGSSYSSAYTAALATRILQLRPWANPSQVRRVILNSALNSGDHRLLKIPDFEELGPLKLTYSEWIARYEKSVNPGEFPSGLGSKTTDPDGDGVINLVEYLCGMDPRYQDAQHAPQMVFNEANSQLEISMQLAEYLDTENGADWEIQSSTDLLTWSGAGQGNTSLAPETPDNGDGRNLSSNFPFYDPPGIFPPTIPKRFYRLRVFDTTTGS